MENYKVTFGSFHVLVSLLFQPCLASHLPVCLTNFKVYRKKGMGFGAWAGQRKGPIPHYSVILGDICKFSDRHLQIQVQGETER